MMDKFEYIIRLEKEEDYKEVENLVRESFWNVYRPGCLEHYVINQIRHSDLFVPELDFVMEKDGRLIGQSILVRATVKTNDGQNIPIMTLGPICILAKHRNKGYGSILLNHSLKKAMELGCGAVFLDGDLNFYGKSGFSLATDFSIRYHGFPKDEDCSFLLCRELIPGYLNGISGEYYAPKVYLAHEGEVEKFDKSFPPKEKIKLPGQLFQV